MWIILSRKKRTKTWLHADMTRYKTKDIAIEQAQQYIADEGEERCLEEFGVVEILDSKVKIVKMEKDNR